MDVESFCSGPGRHGVSRFLLFYEVPTEFAVFDLPVYYSSVVSTLLWPHIHTEDDDDGN